ncbi:hypothetical protein FHS55_001571 [Angulomicrobium tetraedrale]|uniref:Uncharacterized protein n=1 Tax=Ancylobacter tetraedralis TaxID=217068 RepID=A0A839Z8E9_9HYPH|nr:hypothetical protein [Ancylobacter tetraedralis]MBB3770976.1 hypothetical protein [Ancylobacter tetraedralis]
MHFHIERRLRFHTQPDYGGLYSWAINEVDADGKVIGTDQIPWNWGLHFSASLCVFRDEIEIKQKWQEDEGYSATAEVAQRRILRIQLRPGHPYDEGNFHRHTSFSMFGTERPIKKFQLDIEQLSNEAEPERCVAWGSVSYTTEVDFREDTVEDCIVFSLFVKKETFARYEFSIASRAVDEMVFSVRWVDGFYSDWSPSISTRSVKVLTRGEEHAIQLPLGLDFDLPRLGAVGEANLYLSRRLELVKRVGEADDESGDDGGTAVAALAPSVESAPDPVALQAIASLRKAAWLIVALLALIFLALLSKR